MLTISLVCSLLSFQCFTTERANQVKSTNHSQISKHCNEHYAHQCNKEYLPKDPSQRFGAPKLRIPNLPDHAQNARARFARDFCVTNHTVFGIAPLTHTIYDRKSTRLNSSH